MRKRLARLLKGVGVVISLAIVSEIRGAINFIVDAQRGAEAVYADFAADIKCSLSCLGICNHTQAPSLTQYPDPAQ
jgi:hypothetical protein